MILEKKRRKGGLVWQLRRQRTKMLIKQQSRELQAGFPLVVVMSKKQKQRKKMKTRKRRKEALRERPGQSTDRKTTRAEEAQDGKRKESEGK